ncbi:MAG: mannose-1-phosphate guanylyltransferase/mannose-6-phosphate isomerase [Anderseniella sp.]
MKLISILLCGGFGERLWPLSRKQSPKQFAPLVGDTHLFAQCVERVSAFADKASIIAVGNEDHRFLIAESLSDHDGDWSLLLEPVARNTAAAICAAAILAQAQSAEDPTLVVLPCDHHIPDTDAFGAIIAKAAAVAQQGVWVTLGIQPDNPSTQYGYILTGLPQDHTEALPISSFKEKPDLEMAETLLTQGALWNAGIFIVKASTALASFRQHQPEIFAACNEACKNTSRDGNFIRLEAASFEQSPSLPVDIAIMEKLPDAMVVPFAGAWSDLGSWAAVAEFADHDAAGNSKSGDAHFINSTNTFISARARLTYAIGMKDTIIIDTPDALVVAAASEVANIRQAVTELKKAGRPEIENHARVVRPWGSFESLATGAQYQVKRITVKPGAALSLQYHHHRAEHWVVVSGIARVTCGEKIFDLNANQSTYIPLGETHRLENPGSEPLEIIEVQSGDYLGEDDIVRIDDVYGRSGRND